MVDPATTELLKLWGPYAIILVSVTLYFVKKERDFHRERLEYTQQLLKIIKDTAEMLGKVNESIDKLSANTDKLCESVGHLRILRRFLEKVMLKGKGDLDLGEDDP